LFLSFFFSMIPPPPTSTLFPYTTLFRSAPWEVLETDKQAAIPQPLPEPGPRSRHRWLSGSADDGIDGQSSAELRSIPTVLHGGQDRKSTRLNSSHRTISYAVFCLKKKKK